MAAADTDTSGVFLQRRRLRRKHKTPPKMPQASRKSRATLVFFHFEESLSKKEQSSQGYAPLARSVAHNDIRVVDTLDDTATNRAVRFKLDTVSVQTLDKLFAALEYFDAHLLHYELRKGEQLVCIHSGRQVDLFLRHLFFSSNKKNGKVCLRL